MKHECYYIYGRCHGCGAVQPRGRAPLATPPGSAAVLVTLLVRAREYVDAYVENCDVPAGVTGGLALLDAIDEAVSHQPNAEVRDRRPSASDLSATANGGSLH